MTERRAGFRGSVRNSNLNTQSVRYFLETQMEPLRNLAFRGEGSNVVLWKPN